MSIPVEEHVAVRRERPRAAFDERYWPVAAALLVLSSLGGLAIWQWTSFDDPRWWANGWSYLTLLAGVTLLLLATLGLFGRASRAIQLAALLSLLVHVALFASLKRYRLEAVVREPVAARDSPLSVEEQRVPDYHIRAPEAAPEAFELPVETDLPASEQAEEAQRREQPLEQELPDESPPEPASLETPQVDPQVMPLERPEEETPDAANEPAELDRAEAEPVEPEQPLVEAPEQAAAAEPGAPAVATIETERAEALQRALPIETAPPEAPAGPQTIESDLPARADQRPAESPSVEPPPALADRSTQAAQLEAPQVENVPEAERGVDHPLDDPIRLAEVPVQKGRAEAALGTTGRLPSPTPQIVTEPAARTAPALAAPRRTADQPAGSAQSPLTAGEGTMLARRPAASTAPAGSAQVPIAADMAGDHPGIEPGPETQSSPQATVPGLERTRSPGSDRVPSSTNPLPGPPRKGEGEEQVDPTTLGPSTLGRPPLKPSGSLPLAGRDGEGATPATDSTPSDGLARLPARRPGRPLIDGRSREPTRAYAGRRATGQRPAGTDDQHSERADGAIQRGLAYLASQQRPAGNWNLRTSGTQAGDPTPTFQAETAATGLAVLAFLGAGHDHYGGTYAKTVQRGLDFLIQHQRPSGDLYIPEVPVNDPGQWLYSHGMAATALCEAYGMTGDDALAGPAQRAIDFIIANQDPASGAWRAVPRGGSDTSVSGWQLAALKSGELAGLRVPPATYNLVRRWMQRGQTALGASYLYNPGAFDEPSQPHGREPSPSMSAIGLLMRLYTGADRNDAQVIRGAEYLQSHLPEHGTPGATRRDAYYWYYGTQVMFHMRGRYWQAWNGRLEPLLIESQVARGPLAGSWDPRTPVPDRWGARAGRVYVTALNLMSLEVYSRHLPLYDATAQ